MSRPTCSYVNQDDIRKIKKPELAITMATNNIVLMVFTFITMTD